MTDFLFYSLFYVSLMRVAQTSFKVDNFYILFSAYGLRDAAAYILVFDLLCPDSFDYIQGLFSQISETRNRGNIPVIVVGNKTDKVHKNLSTSRMRQVLLTCDKFEVSMLF